MEDLLYISAIIVALAFVLLVIFAVRTFLAVTKSLDHMKNTMTELKEQVVGITKETEQLLHRTNQLADDLQQKSESLNMVFDSVKDMGQAVQQVNQSVRHVADRVATETERQSGQIAQVVQWGNVAIDLYKRFKERTKVKDVNQTKEEL
ncbi:DUF948 domain-containing protein [Halalkalibacterium halodurans]|jgi:uncharacterized protein YoxC|uniref:DUF948 domain-containing protein n=1 Tax=Halalkalibacterium halodurans TaxID=86665 RepID=UPI002E22D409|nr:DUF948 domain-containing protein [Halalkalibacterium halodurans]